MDSIPENQPRASWRIVVDAASDKGAHVLLRRTLKLLGAQVDATVVEPYHKGGFVLRFEVPVVSAVWSEAVFDLLAAAQRLGRAWQLHGDIHEEVSAHTSEANVQGVRFLHLGCRRTDNAAAEASSNT
jgi:hypothetical protein